MMKKSIEGITLFIGLLVLAACSSNTGAHTSPAIQPSTQTNTARQVSATATISAGFLALLATEIPVITPTYATLLPVTGTPQPTLNEGVSAEEESIKKVIRDYFDLRYYAFSTSNSNGLKDSYFDDLLSNEPETPIFLELELAKLRMELKHAELNNLKYTAYEYFLEYENISFDPDSQRATVVLSKRENIIYEISAMLASGEPIMSSGSGEKHTIILHKEEGEWKIVSDEYRDYVWRMLRKSGASTDEILHTLASMLENQKAAPTPINMDCFRGDRYSKLGSKHVNPPFVALPDFDVPTSVKVKRIYLNEKSYDAEWTYSFPFTNLYFQPDGDSPLRFLVEVENISLNQFLDQAGPRWKIVIYPHAEENTVTRPVFVLNHAKKISCDSRSAFLIETSLEAIQKELGNHRIFDYSVVNERGETVLQHQIYLNSAGSYLISDVFGDVTRLDGGIIGYPNLMDESKRVFPYEGKVIVVQEPRGGFFQLHYFAKQAIRWYSGLWTEETPYKFIIQVFSYRDDGEYDPENAYIFPEHRIIKGRRSFNFEVSFTFDELKDALGQGNEFYLRVLDKAGNILGDDYLYFVPYAEPTP